MSAVLKSGGDNREARSQTIGQPDVISLVLAAATTVEAIITGLQGSGQVVGFEYICPATDTDTSFNLNFFSDSEDASGNKIEIGNKDSITCSTGAETVAFVDTTADNIYLGPGSNQIQAEFATAQSITVQVLLYVK